MRICQQWPNSPGSAIPDGVELDLGASAKAWAADWIAESCTEELRVGCLVNLGGDIAVRGEVPEGGWQVEIDDDRPGPKGRPVIAMSWPGGLATSSAVVRTWRTATGDAITSSTRPLGTQRPVPGGRRLWPPALGELNRTFVSRSGTQPGCQRPNSGESSRLGARSRHGGFAPDGWSRSAGENPRQWR